MHYVAVLFSLYTRVYYKLIHVHIVHIIWSPVISKAAEIYARENNETPEPNL
jgi:hypothetical protein